MLSIMMLRTFFKSDISSVLAIEESVHVTPWTRETFETCFRSGYLGWVAEIDNKIVGFVIVSLHREECHILNLGVSHEQQRQGIGRKLLEYALNYAKQQGIGIAYLEVRRSNARAISLYRKMKFYLVGERKNYYPSVSEPEDALIFAMSLVEEFP